MEQILNLRQASELVGNDSELLKTLLESFVNDKKLDKNQITILASREDKTEAAKYVHYYKGAGRQLCAEKMALSGQNLEDVLRGRKNGNIAELTEIFYADYLEALDSIKDALELL